MMEDLKEISNPQAVSNMDFPGDADNRSFFVLDEINPSDNEEYDDNPDDSLSDNDIDEMLEKGYIDGKESAAKRQRLDSDGNVKENDVSGEFSRREKVVLVERRPDHFEVLPDGWIAVTHASGMPVYLHRSSRVCTFGKPYFLGAGSCRNHRVPISAIPCLDYIKAAQDQPQNITINGLTVPQAQVITAEENTQQRQIGSQDLNEYCSKRFDFKKIEILRFKSWQSRRKHFTKQRQTEERPSLPQNSKLITCPIQPTGVGGGGHRQKEWIMNPNGKTYVCILHDYVQRALKERPVYTFKELENTATPYLVSISINGVEYGKGIGSSKKLAKMEAAKATLEILIPDIKNKIEEDPRMAGTAGEKKVDTDLSFFDDIKITDPRVVEFCVKTTEPLPHTILLTCLQRNFGLSEMNVSYEMKPMKHSLNEFTMKVGPHVATVQCQNKRDGKQRASQMLLQALHPHILCWGSLLRLYGSTSVKSYKEKKIEEQEITALQSKGVSHSPNFAILEKLRTEMLKLKEAQKEVQSMGTFIPPANVKMPTSSTCDLNSLNI